MFPIAGTYLSKMERSEDALEGRAHIVPESYLIKREVESNDSLDIDIEEMELREKEGLNLTAVAGAETLTAEFIRYYCSVIAVVTMLLCCSDVA